MCGRFTLVDPRTLFERFGLKPPPNFKPHYNVAPGQDHPVILAQPPGYALRWMRWGLIPSWAQDPAIGYKSINARGETVAEKPAFRDSFRKRRCLVPADGFYEWRPPALSGAEGPAGAKRKIPLRFTAADGGAFAFAGLWSSWKHEAAEPVETFSIVTIAADGAFSPVHDREPVILPEAAARRWLDPAETGPRLLELLRPFPTGSMQGYEVSTVVNAAVHDAADCVAPAGPWRWP